MSISTRRRNNRFNPTLVRLRPSMEKCNLCVFVVFQSHAGSIEAIMGVEQVDRVHPRFNPTLVRLRPGKNHLPASLDPSFNPTLVRLRPSSSETPGTPDSSFQSHAGSIEAGYGMEKPLWFWEVSIPRWFD